MHPTDAELDAWALQAETEDEAARQGALSCECDRAQAAWEQGGQEARLRAEAEPEWRQGSLDLEGCFPDYTSSYCRRCDRNELKCDCPGGFRY
jgi:hypothetical protein